MNHAFIMNPLGTVKPDKDTTYFLMLAAAARGHNVGFIAPRKLWLENEKLYTEITWLKVQNDRGQPFVKLQQTECRLDEMDVIWIRTDPPFDRRYFYTTLLLDRVINSVKIINRPSSLRSLNEKLAALEFAQFTPPTLITCNYEQIIAFANQHKRIVIKPIDGFGGTGIVFFTAGEDEKILRQATQNGSHLVVVQQYLPAAKDGDKRILLVNGEPLGGILRVHAAGVELNNLDAGGAAQPCELTRRDLEICTAIKPALTSNGIFFAGIDIIGDHLIEINVTSPTGLQQLCQFHHTDYHHQIIAALEPN